MLIFAQHLAASSKKLAKLLKENFGNTDVKKLR